MQARLLLNEVERGKDIVMLRAKRVGDGISNNSLVRRNGFRTYLKDKGLDVNIIECTYDIADKTANDATFRTLFNEHKNIGGMAVFNSRSYIVANHLKANSIQGIKLVGYGLIDKNISLLREGYITYLLSERPDKQGRLALRAILEYLLYGKQAKAINNTPVDILISENVDYYIDSIEG